MQRNRHMSIGDPRVRAEAFSRAQLQKQKLRVLQFNDQRTAHVLGLFPMFINMQV